MRGTAGRSAGTPAEYLSLLKNRLRFADGKSPRTISLPLAARLIDSRPHQRPASVFQANRQTRKNFFSMDGDKAAKVSRAVSAWSINATTSER